MTTAPALRPSGPLPSAAGAAEIPFETSGHSGRPVRWWRTPRQLHDEALLVAAAGLGTVERVVCFAPPRHLFGRLFGVVLPELLGVPAVHAWRDPASVPSLHRGPRTLFVCLPSSWLMLRSLLPATTGRSGAVALHGTGPVTTTARELVRDRRGTAFDAVEVFGSTETGAIAVRPIAAADEPERPWRLLDDVDAPIGEDGLLTVRGPRLARPDGADRPVASWSTGDVVTPAGRRSFRWRGRASRMIKVNGIRCDLGAVEAAIGSAFPGVEIVCTATSDPLRGERYELFHTGGGEHVDARSVRTAIATLLPGCPLPAAVHAVGRIPHSDTGKPLPHRLPAFRTTTTDVS
ncbi:class I adenylate-forming enzyme family protein [Streptomyces sp. NPDC089915]|uniref:class I adenylate-forming enzyme family protein n=1 Tax=Streptomyces sp. NPDC089915 TaxID=3155186 RepID=UPI0034446B77